MTLSSRLRQVQEALEFYQRIDDQIVKFTDGFAADINKVDERSVARRGLAALSEIIKETQGWQDISTAPKDGTQILWLSTTGNYCVIEWDTYKECFEEAGSLWQPLPPTDKQGE